MKLEANPFILALAVCVTACGAEYNALPDDATGAQADGMPIAEAGDGIQNSTGRRAELHEIYKQNPSGSAAQAALDELRAMDRASWEQTGLLLEVELGPGHSLYISEPSPGRISLREKSGPLDESVIAKTELWPDGNVRTLYEALRPGEALPEVLSAALQRRDEAAASTTEALEPGEDEATASQPPAGQPMLAEQPDLLPQKQLTHVASGPHFRDDQHGCIPLLNPSRTFCWLTRTGNWLESKKSTKTSQTLAMVSGNLMTWRTREDEGESFTTVHPNELWTWSAEGKLACDIFNTCEYKARTLEGQVLDAEVNVDIWHFGGSFSNDPSRFFFLPTPRPANN
jgi:hypothetical protein